MLQLDYCLLFFSLLLLLNDFTTPLKETVSQTQIITLKNQIFVGKTSMQTNLGAYLSLQLTDFEIVPAFHCKLISGE